MDCLDIAAFCLDPKPMARFMAEPIRTGMV
jgi:hypothetical protein